MARSPKVHLAVMRQLNIEVMGPRANRQIVELQKRIASPHPSDPAPRKQAQEDPKPKPVMRQVVPPEPAELKIVPSEIRNDSPDVLHLPQATAPVVTYHAAGVGTPARSGNAAVEQRPQSVGRQASEADLINAYISALAKLVNSHLIYPKEVRKKNLEGTSWVSFTVTDTGAIKPNSLEVKKSSGYVVLDDNALKTIRSLAPFQKPPREMTISISIEFALD